MSENQRNIEAQHHQRFEAASRAADEAARGYPNSIPTGQEIAAAQQRLTKDLTQRQFASLQVVEMIKGGLAVEADKVIPLVRALHTFLTEQQPS